MGLMIGVTVVVAILTAIGTAIWWAMMNSWVEKDRRGRGRHVNDHQTPSHDHHDQSSGSDADAPRVMRSD